MAKPTAFITGLPGFAGSYLAEELLNHGYDVVGTRYGREPLDNIAAIRKQIRLVSLDILKPERCRELIEKIKPDYVFHLAAMASVGQSFSLERLTFRINVEGTLNMLEASAARKGLKRFVFISSSDCYGLFTPKTKTLTENQPLNPVSPYGISKAAAERAVQYYQRQYGLPVGVARSFNHSGPRQIERFVIPAFARQVALIETGRQKPVLQVGDLSVRRDLSDVRDIVRGYRLIAEKGRDGGVYQLCSGRAVSIQSVLDTLVSLSSKRITVKIDKSRLRKADIPVLRGSHAKATREIGFRNEYTLKTTLIDTLTYWRNKVSER